MMWRKWNVAVDGDVSFSLLPIFFLRKRIGILGWMDEGINPRMGSIAGERTISTAADSLFLTELYGILQLHIFGKQGWDFSARLDYIFVKVLNR